MGLPGNQGGDGGLPMDVSNPTIGPRNVHFEDDRNSDSVCAVLCVFVKERVFDDTFWGLVCIKCGGE